MSYPTKELSPLMLEDYRRVMMDRRGEEELFTTAHIANCMKKAKIDRLQLDLLISELTYATTIRGSKYHREREFLQAVHKCVACGGKALTMALTGVLMLGKDAPLYPLSERSNLH